MVAVKWFKDNVAADQPAKSVTDLNDLFMRELHIMSELRHPNIILVMGAIIYDNNRGYIMEKCKSDLYSFIRQRSDLKLSQKLRIAIRLAQAILYLHYAGYVHRDLKSFNILMDHSNEPKLIDFGFCTKLNDYEFGYTDHKLVQNANKGTPAYMAPEMLRNEGYSDRSDVFAFGVILWEMFVLTTRPCPRKGQ
jgi:serine/threonine protein kinase